jgi:hypothetical protein
MPVRKLRRKIVLIQKTGIWKVKNEDDSGKEVEETGSEIVSSGDDLNREVAMMLRPKRETFEDKDRAIIYCLCGDLSEELADS